MIKLETELHNRWTSTWYKIGATGNPDLPFAQLMTQYSEPGRFHHTATHIKSCLDAFDEVAHLAQDPEAVLIAAFGHDVFNDPKRTDNEERSADWTRQVFTAAQVPQTRVDKAHRLVMVSKTHQPSCDDIDEQIMSDMDLLILGSHPIVYDGYRDGIRKEYLSVPFYLFRPGRIAVLQNLRGRLDRGELFHLPYFRYKHEQTAGYNIDREIQELKNMKVAVYAGSFDPPTNGHLHVIERANCLVDNLIIAIGTNARKKGKSRFAVEDRLQMLREITKPFPYIDVTSYPNKVLVDFVKSVGAKIIVRGLRNEIDYPDEAALDEFNIREQPGITTWFTRAPDVLARISSSSVIDLLYYDDWEERVRSRVPEPVYRRIAADRERLLNA